jgi:hypothetical protein
VNCLACAFCAKAQEVVGKSEMAGHVVRTTICEVVSNPGSFDGKIIELRADVFAGLETNILYDKKCGSREQLPARCGFRGKVGAIPKLIWSAFRN